MLLFGHPGITAAGFRIYELVSRRLSHAPSAAGSADPPDAAHPSKPPLKLDYRIVLVGSMLPDIIDKPLWLLTSGLGYVNGRAYAHTFLFAFVLVVGGLVLLRFKKSWLLILGVGSFVHLALDEIWKTPAILWWPFEGPVPAASTTHFIFDIIRDVLTQPPVFLPELLGLVLLLAVFWNVRCRRYIIRFIKTGNLD